MAGVPENPNPAIDNDLKRVLGPFHLIALGIGAIRHTHLAPARQRRLLGEALAGLVRVVRQPTLRGLAVCYSLYQVTWGALIVLVPVVTARHFGAATGEWMAGVLWAGAGAVGVIGALVIGQVRAQGRSAWWSPRWRSYRSPARSASSVSRWD